eukprot:s1345_g3.t1
MELDLFAEVLCDADPALLLGGAAGTGGAHDFGRAGRAVAWLADVGSAIFQTGSKKRQGPAAGTEPSDRLAQLQPALKLVADLLEASPESKGSTLVAAALDALREGSQLSQLLSGGSTSSSSPAPMATSEDAAGHEAVALGAAGAVAKAVRIKAPGCLCIVPAPFGLVILRRCSAGSAAGCEYFMAGVASFSPGLRFHPARPREDGDMERMQPLVLGQVPRERVTLGTFWHLACQPPKRMDADELHPYASLLPFLTGVPADASPVQSPETARLTHWRPMSTGNSGRGEALQVVLDGLEFALRLMGADAPHAARLARVEPRVALARRLCSGASASQRLVQELAIPSCSRHAADVCQLEGDLEDPRRSPAMDLKTSINSLEESLKAASRDVKTTAASAFPSLSQELPCLKSHGSIVTTPADSEFHLFGPGFTADSFRVAEEMAGQPLPADLLSPPDLAEVGPHDVQNPADLVQLLGRACSSCLKLLNQQRLLTSAHHLCFSLAARVLLSLPLDRSWYKRPDFNWTLETQNFILERLHLLIRQLAMAALALGPAGDAGPRAVAAMAAAVAFDAVARQPTENVTSLLSQALGQGLCLGPGSFVSESSEQAISWPRAAKARSEILEYFEAASIAGHQPVFQGVEVGHAELQLLNGCSLLLGLGPVRSTAVQLLSGEDPSLMAQLPQLGMMRDVGFLAQLLSRSGALPLTTPKSGNQNVLGNLSWRSQEGSTSLTVRGLAQGPATVLEALLPVGAANSKDKQSGVLARMKKGLLGLTGAERRSAAASQADSGIASFCDFVPGPCRAAKTTYPGALVGEKLRSEEDVLFLPSSKLRAFEGLSPSEAEVVLTMLLAPYLRIPLLLGYLGTSERVGALADERLQGVLEAAVFEPGPWRSSTRPPEIPEARKMVQAAVWRGSKVVGSIKPVWQAIPAPTRSHLATPCGLLINELCNAPRPTLAGAAALLQSALERDTGRAAAAPIGLILFAIRMGCRIFSFAKALLESEGAGSLAVAIALGAGRPSVEAAVDPLQKQLLASRKVLQRWATEAAEHGKAALACAVWSHLAMLQSCLGWGEAEAPVALLASQLLMSMHGLDAVFERSEGRSSFSESHASPMVRAGSGQLPGAEQDPMGGGSACEMFAILAEERTNLARWLRQGGSQAAAALEAAVAIASLSRGNSGATASSWTEVRPGVFMRSAEAPLQDNSKLRPGQKVEEYLQLLASLPKLAYDTNLGSFAMQQGELQVLPGWASNSPELQDVFGESSELHGILSSLVQRTEHRECINLAGQRCDVHHWTPDPRPWPNPVAARGARCSWLDEAVKAAGGLPTGLGASRLLGSSERMARLACEVEGIEVIVLRDPPVVQVFEQCSHARMVFRRLRWTSDACWCFTGFASQEPWSSGSGIWCLCSGQGGIPGSSGKQPPAPGSKETVLIQRDLQEEGKAVREALVPSDLMRGLLPETLLRAFRFWRGTDGLMRGEERHPTQPGQHLQVERIDDDRVRVWRYLASSHVDAAQARQTPHRQLLLNLMLSQSDSPLRRLADVLTRIEDLAFILCWADEQGRVAEVALPRLGLNFKVNRQGCLECLGFGGLSIAAEARLAEQSVSSKVRHRLQQFGGAALLLQGEEGELAVLCSALQRPRRPAGGPSPVEWGAPLVFDRSKRMSSDSPGPGHYFFSLHSSQTYAQAQDLAAELYRLTCCWLMHRYDEVVRSASSLGCDALTSPEAALWSQLGSETAHDQHVDAHACRLHLSTALQPLGLEPPWSVRDAYVQFLLNRHHCSASCLLTPELELQVLKMVPELDGISWLLRNRRRILEAQSGVLVCLEPPPLAPGDGYEVKVFSETSAAEWASTISLAPSAEEHPRSGPSALRFIEQQLSSGPFSMQQAFEIFTRVTSLQPFPDDAPHLVAACLARAYGPASAALAALARDEGLVDKLPKAPKKQGLLPTAAHKRWLQEVREKLASAVRSSPLPEPPAPAAVPREVLLQHGALRLAAWPIVQIADCDKRTVSGIAALRKPLKEICESFFNLVPTTQGAPALAPWLLREIQADQRCTSRGARWVKRLEESLLELQATVQVPALRGHIQELTLTLQRLHQLPFKPE